MKTVWPWRSLSTTPRAYATPLCLFAFASLVYVNTLGNAFVLDDGPRIATNPLIRDLGNIPTLFASDYSAPGAGSGLYRPLVTTSYAFNFALAGLEPMSYHAVNVVLHALVSVLVWAVYRRLVGSALAAGAGAFLFAVHAVHTEAVANVAGRAELLSAVFFLISFLGYLRRRETPGRRAFGLYATSLGAYLLALLSKESAVTLLGVIPLYDFVYGKAKAQRLLPRLWETMIGLWRPYAGYVATTVVYLGVRLFVLGAGHALPPPLQSDNPLVTLDLPWRILNTLQDWRDATLVDHRIEIFSPQ